jgi:hypothetical protein
MTTTPRKQGPQQGLAGVFAQLSTGKDRTCNVGKLLAEFDPETAASFRDVLDNLEVSNNRIRAALLTDGIRMSRDTISDHRRGRCSCPRTEG